LNFDSRTLMMSSNRSVVTAGVVDEGVVGVSSPHAAQSAAIRNKKTETRMIYVDLI